MEKIISSEELKPKEIDYTKFYVKPHKKISKKVTEKDFETVMNNGSKMVKMFFVGNGKYPAGFAIAHSQIEEKNPLRFFVTKDSDLIVNPIITRHTENTVDSIEGCLSFPNNPMTLVKRWNKIEVNFQTFNDNGKLTDIEHIKLSGKKAKIFQHEIDHLNGINIYD